MADRTVVYRLRADAQQFSAQMKAAGASVKDAADKMTAANKEGDKFRKGLDTFGSTAGKVGLVAAAGLGAAIVKAANFDQAMSNVKAATHETAENMDLLREAALKAGAETAFSATEAAAGIEELSKAGIQTTDILGGGLAGALDLAAAGGVGVAEAAETAASAMTQFKLSGEQVPHIADLLAAAAGKAQGSVHDMGMALSQSGLVASQVGLSIEETTGALGAFASAGLIGSDAGTSLKTMLLNLTPSSAKAAKMMDALGISAYDANGNFIGLSEYAGVLQGALANMSAEQRNATLKTIFGNDAIRAANVLYEQGAEGISEWISKVDDQGYAAETASTRLDNLKGDLEQLGGALETALIGTGSGSQGMLRDLTQGLTDVINKYNDLPQSAKTATSAIMGGAALVGGSIWVGSKLVQGISNTRDALENLGISGTKATKAMKGLAATGAIVAGLVAVTQAAEGLRAKFDETLPGTEKLTGRLMDLATSGSASALGDEFDSLGESIDRLASKRADQEMSDTIGSLVGVESNSLHDATREVEALDSALANLVTSAGPEVAARAFTSLYESGALTATQLRDLGERLPQYQDALAGAANSARVAATDTSALGGAMKDAEQATDNFKATLDGLNAILSGRANMRDYEAAIDDFTKSLKENGRTFDINTEKGRNNQAALDNIATSALKVAENLEGAARKRFLTNAIDDIRTMAKNMGLPKSEINKLIELLRTANSTNVKPNISVDTGSAMSAIERIRAALANIKDKSVTVRVTQTGAAVTPGFGPQANAAGGYITGPGGPTDDAIPSYLSNGEYVIKAAAVQKYGVHMFDRLNAMHFAEGGKVEKDKKKPYKWTRDFSGVDGFKGETMRDLNQFVRRQERAAERQREAADALVEAAGDQQQAAQSAYDAAVAQRDQAGRAAVAGFDTGLFDRDSNPWAAGAGGGWMQNLGRDIAGLQERQGLINQLSGQGLTGTALEALLARGTNADISTLIANGQVGQFAAMYAQREALQGSVAASAGDAAFGKNVEKMAGQLASANSNLAQANAQNQQMIRQLEQANRQLEQQADKFADALNGAASAAQRHRNNRGR